MILERSRLLHRIFNKVAQAHVWLYRRTNGRLGGKWKGGPPILLLDHVGRKSGKLRTSPLVYTPDGDDLLVVASFGGAEKDPVWWVNLKTHPLTSVQVKSERRNVQARLASPEEKAAAWPKLIAANSDYDKYQQKTDRDIPVVILERR